MEPFENIIRKLSFDIDVHGKSSTASLGEEIAEFCIREFIPEMEKQLDPFSTSRHMAIDALEMDLGSVPFEHWETIIKDKFNGTFHDELKKILPQPKINKKPSSMPSNLAMNKSAEDFHVETSEKVHLRETSADIIIDAFLFYLVKGYLPWWYSLDSNQSIAPLVVNIITPKKSDLLFQLIKHKPKPLDRIMMTYSNNEMVELLNIHKIPKRYIFVFSEIFDTIKSTVSPNLSANNFRRVFWKILIKHYDSIKQKSATSLGTFLASFISHDIVRKGINASDLEDVQKQLHTLYENLQKILDLKVKDQKSNKLTFVKGITSKLSVDSNQTSNHLEIHFETNINRDEVKSFDKKLNLKLEIVPPSNTPYSKDNEYNKVDQLIEEEEKEGVFVHHAGIVLIHPFLRALFSTLNLLDNEQWNNDESSAKAVHLLAYMSAGSLNYPEHESVLFKQLCGLSWDTVIDSKLNLSQQEKTECESLLGSVLEHWTALKNTSIDGLREGFINRSGKLWKDGTIWQLQIEQKSQDILIERLPWGIGIIKFPWIKEIIQVNWI